MKLSAISLVFALLLLATTAMAATQVIPMDASNSILELDSREGDALRFNVEIAKLEAID
ncbi:MAG: hypothetical protein GY835_09905, partial [bacterium]|nr:hypothetical protein [bacterium]